MARRLNHGELAAPVMFSVMLAEKVIAILQTTVGRGEAVFEAVCVRLGVEATANRASASPSWF